MPTEIPNPGIHLTFGRVAACYGPALVLTAVIPAGWAAATGAWPCWPALGLAWGIIVVHAAAGLAIKRAGLGGSLTRLFAWTFLVSPIRAAILVTIVVAVDRSAMATSPAFEVAIWTGFFSCLFAEVLVLHLSTVAGDRSGI